MRQARPIVRSAVRRGHLQEKASASVPGGVVSRVATGLLFPYARDNPKREQSLTADVRGWATRKREGKVQQ